MLRIDNSARGTFDGRAEKATGYRLKATGTKKDDELRLRVL